VYLAPQLEKSSIMTKVQSRALLTFSLFGLSAVACATEVPDDGGGATGGSGAVTGGSGGVSGASGSAPTGGVSTGGTVTGGTGGTTPTGGTSTGGTIATGGSSGAAGAGGSVGGAGSGTGGSAGGGATGGSSMGGSGGAVAGSGGAGGAGGKGGSAGASGGKGGSGGGGSAPDPSAGCGKSTTRPADVNVSKEKRYMFPTTYNGTTPFPLLIALHACGNENSQWVNMTNNTGFATEYVRAFPNTTDSGQCWSNYNNNIARIKQQYDEVMNTYCIDKKRVFGIGHSSGAQMLVNILSHASDANYLKFRAVAPDAADPFNVAVPMPVMLIQSPQDNQRGSGSAANTIARFRTSNGCQSTSTAYTNVMQCNSSDGGARVNANCLQYDGCTVPTIWCGHDDPSYSGTHHGVPCFGVKAMYDFFATFI
jgi:polyhydroxybutyrate depolymerase